MDHPRGHPLEPSSSAATDWTYSVQQESVRVSLGDDPYLVSDLLRRAGGDSGKVASWLSEMSSSSHAASAPPAPTMNGEAKSAAHVGEDIDAAAQRLGAPDTFFCPISFHLMRDPVLISTGQTYERRAIVKWLAQGTNITCPATMVPLSLPVPLTPNVALRKAIEDWTEKNAPWMLDASKKLLPIPNDDGHLSTQGSGAKLIVDTVDRDLALALRLQDEETQGLANQRAPLQVDGEREARLRVNTFRYPVLDELAVRKRVQRSIYLLVLLTLIHLGVFVYTLFRNDWQFENISMNPLIGFGTKVLDEVGATDTPQIVEKNEWWRLGSSMFISAGIVHLEGNVGALWTFGRFLAGQLSFISLGALYLSSGLVGILVSANVSSDVVTCGSSAAVFGLIGAMIVELIIYRRCYRMHFVSFIVLLAVGAINAVIGLTPLVDNWANIGGFLTGILAGTALLLSHRQMHPNRCVEFCMVFLQVLFGILVVCLMAGGVAGLLAMWEGGEKCGWCKNVTCYDTQWWKCDSARILPEDCAFNIEGDLTTSIKCPMGHVETVPIQEPTQANLEKLCSEICYIRRQTPSVRLPSVARGDGALSPSGTPSQIGLEVPDGGTKNTLE